jgi:hypothetical protein
MKFEPNKATVVEADAILSQHVDSILTDAGFQCSSEQMATPKNIVESRL